MDEEIETHRGQIIYTLGKWDYNTSSVTPYSQLLHHTCTDLGLQRNTFMHSDKEQQTPLQRKPRAEWWAERPH